MERLEGAKVEALRKFLPVNDDLAAYPAGRCGPGHPCLRLLGGGFSMVADKFQRYFPRVGGVVSDSGKPEFPSM